MLSRCCLLCSNKLGSSLVAELAASGVDEMKNSQLSSEATVVALSEALSEVHSCSTKGHLSNCFGIVKSRPMIGAGFHMWSLDSIFGLLGITSTNRPDI